MRSGAFHAASPRAGWARAAALAWFALGSFGFVAAADAQITAVPRAAQSAPGVPARPPAAAPAPAAAVGTQAPVRAPQQTSADRIALNFKDADIDSVVGAFGHLLNRAFLIDPRVRGKITLETPEPVSRARAFELLQAALRVQGFATVDSGTLIRVVPEADAKLQSGSVSVGRSTDRGGDQVLTQVFRLNYESATNLVPVLRPLITPNNTITAYPSNNSLVITDYAANLQRLARIISTLDSPSTSEVEVVPIKHAVASDVAIAVARMTDDTARAGAGAQVDPGQRLVVAADPRMNSVMLRSASMAKMNLAKSLIARIDQPSTELGNIHVVYLRNAEALKLAQVLRGVLSGDSGAFGAAGAGGFGSSGQGALGGGFGVGVGGGFGGTQGAMGAGVGGASATALGQSGATTPLQSGQPQPSGPATFSAGGAIIAADPSTNSLIITAPDPVYRNLRAVIDRLDARRAQVFIESLIVEVAAEQAAEFGVQWQFLEGLTDDSWKAFGGTNLPARGGGGNILDVIANPLSAGQGLNIGVAKGTITIGDTTILNLGVLARALETRANANILATPNLLTLDNEEARIIIGQNVPFLTGSYSATGTVGASVNPFQTIERKDVGTTLRVRPQVSESGSVRLQIFQEVSNVAAQTAQGLITNRRAIESNVLVDDGQIVVLGGLIEERIEGGEQKVPALGDVPWLGQLFRYDNRKRVKTNLLVFLRPVVLRDAAGSYGVSSDRYDYIRQLQGDSRLPQHWLLPEFPPSDVPPMSPPPGATGAAPGASQAAPGARLGPASLSPDIERAVRRAAPAPVTESVPSIVTQPPAGPGGN